MIKIVTDSDSDIPPEIAQRHGITVAPLYIHIGTETFRDGIDIHTAEFLPRLQASTQLPTTSQIPPGDFLEIYRSLTTDDSEIISIRPLAQISGTVASAQAAGDLEVLLLGDYICPPPAMYRLKWRSKTSGIAAIYDFWNVVWSQSGNTVTAKGVGWNNILQLGKSTQDVGFCAHR